jgi:hypothetical protein
MSFNLFRHDTKLNRKLWDYYRDITVLIFIITVVDPGTQGFACPVFLLYFCKKTFYAYILRGFCLVYFLQTSQV